MHTRAAASEQPASRRVRGDDGESQGAELMPYLEELPYRSICLCMKNDVEYFREHLRAAEN